MMKEEQVLVKGIKTNYKIGGEGEPILVLHGWGGSSDSWAAVCKLLSKDFKVICPDLPGFGKTEVPPEPWNVNDYVHWILEFADRIGLERFNLVSHSFGGRVAIKMAVKHPDYIKSLIFCGPAGVKIKASFYSSMIIFLAEVGNVFLSLKIFRTFRNVARSFLHLFIRHRDYTKLNGVMRESMKKVLKEDLSPYLKDIKIKTLLIWGSNDKMVPIRIADVFHKDIEGSELEIIENMGHSPHLGVPETVYKLITKFVKS